MPNSIGTHPKLSDVYIDDLRKDKGDSSKTLSKLLPLKEKLQKTDWLIDQIVDRLYGLTDEEIKIVEGHKQSKWDSDC
jgi:hypothetical protein